MYRQANDVPGQLVEWRNRRNACELFPCVRVRAAQAGEDGAAGASLSIAECGRFHVHAWGYPRGVGSREGGAGTRAGGDAVGGSVDNARKGAGNFDGSVLRAKNPRFVAAMPKRNSRSRPVSGSVRVQHCGWKTGRICQ